MASSGGAFSLEQRDVDHVQESLDTGIDAGHRQDVAERFGTGNSATTLKGSIVLLRFAEPIPRIASQPHFVRVRLSEKMLRDGESKAYRADIVQPHRTGQRKCRICESSQETRSTNPHRSAATHSASCFQSRCHAEPSRESSRFSSPRILRNQTAGSMPWASSLTGDTTNRPSRPSTELRGCSATRWDGV
jgi:hypothetical protein